MDCQVTPKDIYDFKSTSILTQTPFWGRIKEKQGFRAKGFELGASTDLLDPTRSETTKKHEDLLVLVKPLSDGSCFAYVPYGPKLEPSFENQGPFLEQLSESLIARLPTSCLFIRYDLLWQNQWSAEKDYFDQHGNWIGPPSCETQEYRLNFNTSTGNLKKSLTDNLPKNTFFIDLNAPEEKLLYNMRFNTRYAIRKAIKQGVQVNEYGIEHIAQWYALYTETALRHELPLQSAEFFSNILANQDNHKKGVAVKMLMAEYEGTFVAAMFLVISGRRATYLYGASSDSSHRLMGAYALQWESIKLAKACGCDHYDMFGSAPNLNKSHPLHGVHVYKKGFGGDLYHRMGCWDYPIDSKIYSVFRTQEAQGFSS